MTKPNSQKAVFLDRDGTLNVDPGYISRPEELHLLPHAKESLLRLRDAGFLLVVVTNQSGVGRGIIAHADLPKIHDRLNHLISPSFIDSFECCLHRPEDLCDCRKPKPKLLLDAAKRLHIDLKKSFMVGDKQIDVEAGRAAHCKASLLVRTGHGEVEEKKLTVKPDFIADSIREATDWILNSET